MPKLNCMGHQLEIPHNGKVCPKLPTSIVPMGTKCEVICDAGGASIEYIKCEKDGWSPTNEVSCSASSTGLVVGLLVGGIIVVCIIAYVYAKMRTKKKNKKAGRNDKAAQPVSRAAKIAALNDMVVTGVVSRDMVKAGVVKQAPRPSQGKLVTGIPDDPEIRHSSSSSQNVSSPPSYHSLDPVVDGGNHDGNSTRTRKSRRSRNSSSTEQHGAVAGQRKQHRDFYDEYAEDINLGYDEGHPVAVMNGQYHSMQDNGPMYPDYYGQRSKGHNAYGAMDHNYYAQDGYHDQYMVGGMDNMAYAHGGNHQKPYHVPI